MEGLSWPTEASCSAESLVKTIATRAFTLSAGSSTTATSCRSNYFVPKSEELSVATASNAVSGDSFFLEAIDAQGVSLAKTPISPSSDWREHTLSLGDVANKSISLVLSQHNLAKPGEKVSVRSRVEYYDRAIPAQTSLPWLLLIALPLATGALLFFFLFVAQASNLKFAAFLLFSTFVVHFRQEVFFYWDEWHVLMRYAKMGWGGAIYTHNEHFLPLFFAFYQGLARALGDYYLLFIFISLCIHSLNACLLARLLERLAGDWSHRREASRLLAFLFALSALHAEALQWAFEASLLLAQTTCLYGLLQAWDGVTTRSPKKLFVGALSCGLSPLFFGNGFATAFQLAAVLCLGALFVETQGRDSHARARLKKRFRWCFAALSSSAFVFAGVAALYIYFRDGSGHTVEDARPFENLDAVVEYLIVGTGLGTILRGIGLYPILQPAAAPIALTHLLPWIPFLDSYKATPDLVFGWIGILTAFVLLLVSCTRGQAAKTLRITAIGLVFMVSALLLPAFGRWQLGAQQSLSLRYHYPALCGLCIFLLPLFCRMLRLAYEKHNRLLTSGLISILTLSVCAQLSAAAFFHHFTAAGRSNREFISQMQSWNEFRTASPKKISWEGHKTKSSGLQPLMPPNLTPGMHPDDIAKVIHWLSPDKYQGS